MPADGNRVEKKIIIDNDTGEVLETETHIISKPRYQFEWNDLRALITVVNVALIMVYGLSIAWFGLAVAVLGCFKDIYDLRRNSFRWSSLIMHLSNVALNIYFIVVLYIWQTEKEQFTCFFFHCVLYYYYKVGEIMKKDKNTIKVKVNQTEVRNGFHFDIQRTTRMNIFRNRKAYSRRRIHKNKWDE